ncbi:thiolase [Kineobactrum sediminis]|uniref:propanoyl-CoA C-acyltransferase n=1 Tax=Kineobactrum sediminis TaxID=1905677 RepID=A0A2N5Y4I1_9GAMM|nr:thiolase family protein [Kineobactrum sediminis]PLW83305.1 thiolase [Kineobactrum sediminis]
MSEVYLIGVYSTDFGKRPGDNVKTLTREAYAGVLADAGLECGSVIDSCWFGNCGMWVEEQGSIRGQVCLTPLVREGMFPERVPVINVEGGCATASMALNGAWKDIAAGVADTVLAIGVEKTFYPDDPAQSARLFTGGIDQYDPQEWQDYYAQAGAVAGKNFAPGPGRSIFMDTYAMQACYHMKTHGTTRAQIAAAAAKNHGHGALNPRAQYRFEMTVDEVLADREVSWPLTRAMCAPVGDGGAAALLVSGRQLRALPAAVRERAVRVLATTLSGGKYRDLDEPGLSRTAAQKAYRQADLGPTDIDVAEVHDATAFCEIYQAEMLGFCEDGQGGAFIESGATRLGGCLPINTSGGLVSKGHPVGATGLSMITELVEQLRGEAGPRQVNGAHTALAENGGGVIGFDEAACSVIILQRA